LKEIRLQKPSTFLYLFGFLFACSPLNAQFGSLVSAVGNTLLGPPAALQTAQTFHERFMSYAILTYGPKAVLAPAFSAGIRMANPPDAYPREWRDGPGAFGRNYGDAFAQRVAKETGRFAVGTLLHEDYRYRPSTSKNPAARALHAVAFTFIDKSDSGNNRIAVANFVGAGAGGFVAELYLPPGYRNLSHAETRAAVAFGSFAGENLFREFEPDLMKVLHKIGLGHVPVRDWWVKRN
jgi:hypothetical protein